MEINRDAGTGCFGRDEVGGRIRASRFAVAMPMGRTVGKVRVLQALFRGARVVCILAGERQGDERG
jgi:hypothetical protein